MFCLVLLDQSPLLSKVRAGTQSRGYSVEIMNAVYQLAFLYNLGTVPCQSLAKKLSHNMPVGQSDGVGLSRFETGSFYLLLLILEQLALGSWGSSVSTSRLACGQLGLCVLLSLAFHGL